MLNQANKRPYIIINDQSSFYVQGLLITSLPPITKAKIRTKAETIDGFDGDIVTALGFSAYDKTAEIALTYDYNIDEVVSFFAQSGRVTFSNEPERYYKFAQYDEIDFERLIRFKKAKVNFHVQPFKYSYIEGKETHIFDNKSGSFMTRNQGNYYSKPTISIRAQGLVKLLINDETILNIDFGESFRTIVIDGETMNATNKAGTTYLNRLVSGDYDKIRLTAGDNKIGISGTVEKCSIYNKSRWI